MKLDLPCRVPLPRLPLATQGHKRTEQKLRVQRHSRKVKCSPFRMEKSCPFHEKFNFSGISEFEMLFEHFCDNDDFSLTYENFKHLLEDLFTDSQGKSYDLSKLMPGELFHIFDKNKDGIIDSKEFSVMYNDFIKPLIKPVTALLIIDVQNDFIHGSLSLKNCPAKQDGSEIIEVINNLIDKYNFDMIAYSLDFHPEDHISFFKNIGLHKLSEKNKPLSEIKMFDTVTFEGPPEIRQKLWPTHCIQNSWGSELHKDLHVARDSVFIYKGTNSFVDSYSAFFDNMKISKTNLDEELKKRNVTHVFICGLAFDYCVSFTAIDASELGYATIVIKDATKGTDDNNIKSMEERLKSVNCVIAHTNEVENLITGKDIRVEFAPTLQRHLKVI